MAAHNGAHLIELLHHLAGTLTALPLCRRIVRMIKLTWLPHWQAYSVRRDGRIIGMLRCKAPLPFRMVVQFS